MGYVGGMVYGNMGKPQYVVWYVLTVWHEKNTVPGIWYDTFAVRYHGTMSWMYYMAIFAWWYGILQYIRSVRVEYVVRISLTSLYIGHWKVFENNSLTDRQSDRQIFIHQNRDSVLQTDIASVYKVRKGRIRRTDICNELIHRPLESVRKYMPYGQTERQAERQTERQRERQTDRQTD